MQRPALRLLPALATTLALGTLACGSGKPATTDPAGPTLVGRENLAIAQQETLQVGPAISGTLEAERSATVRAELGGAVVQVLAEPGQAVAAGQLLARIDDTGVREAYASAQAAVATAELNLTIATRNAERSAALVAAGAVAERDQEQADWAKQSAAAQLADAQARLVTAEKALAKTSVRAPFAGVVSDRPANLGDILQSGNPVVTVVDPSVLKLEGAVEVEALADLKVGTVVHFSAAGLNDGLTGRISRIYPSVDPATRQVRVTVQVPNRGGQLVAGLYADGRVATATRAGVVVPSGAVDRKGLRPFVVRLHQGKVERAEVELGLIDAARERMELTSGVAAGDTLLLGSARGIPVGDAVRIGAAAEKE